jgi:hypothetical protein
MHRVSVGTIPCVKAEGRREQKGKEQKCKRHVSSYLIYKECAQWLIFRWILVQKISMDVDGDVHRSMHSASVCVIPCVEEEGRE